MHGHMCEVLNRQRPPGPLPSLAVRRLIICTASVLAAMAMPAVSHGQTASAAQYGGVEGVVETGPTAPVAPGPTEQEPAPTAEESPPAEAAPTAAPQPEAAPTGRLPFTGQDIVLMLLAGVGLLGMGLALRRATGSAPVGV